ncbi:MAG: NADH-quinone oxidoreductase subunit NuoF [Verrucomicrobiota bacterium]|jgi:bidirectional [NiFe] hydrogenase diaphorase subunit
MQLDDLNAIAEKHKSSRKKICLRSCMSAGCMSSQADVIKKNLEAEVKAQGLEADVEVRRVGCMGFCGQGPLVGVDQNGSHGLWEFVKSEDAPAIVGALKGSPCSVQRGDPNHPFFAKQMHIVRANGGIVDPERIEDYIAIGGYKALHHALTEMEPAQVVEEVTKSGLRGRGGAGFPTGLKWGTVAKSPGAKKYVVCNGDEGDPGAFMDRSVLESDPHLVLEGMAIAAYAIGADQGFLYVRAEYPLAISRLQTAIKQAKQLGLLGGGIFESPFTFNVDIRIGAGAFVCGEETALMASVEGKRGTPRPRPPFPAESGLWGCPTLINNVETFANITAIISRGGAWYAGIGTEKSKGTKVFALTGKIKNNGLIEVPMGIPLRQIVEEMGGGASDGGKIKSVQTGGPSGGCIPAEYLDTPVDYESLTKLGSIMGSGGMVVMDDSTNMVEIAKFYMEFCMDESCGKCIPCRAGTVQMFHLLEKILNRQATARDLAKLEELCDMVKNTSLCGLGQTAPNPVMSTLRFFRKEYEELLQPDEFGPRDSGELKKETTR